MVLNANTKTIGLLVAVMVVLCACGKQGEQPATSTTAAGSSASFPTGNGDKSESLADCDKLPDPKPADDSAASRAAAVGQGQEARAACKREVAAQQDKPNTDLARIRQIKEQELAEKISRETSDEAWRQRVKEAAKAPIKDYKF